jgi:NADH:ubiquinone oxidoreductase subunit E
MSAEATEQARQLLEACRAKKGWLSFQDYEDVAKQTGLSLEWVHDLTRVRREEDYGPHVSGMPVR